MITATRGIVLPALRRRKIVVESGDARWRTRFRSRAPSRRASILPSLRRSALFAPVAEEHLVAHDVGLDEAEPQEPVARQRPRRPRTSGGPRRDGPWARSSGRARPRDPPREAGRSARCHRGRTAARRLPDGVRAGTTASPGGAAWARATRTRRRAGRRPRSRPRSTARRRAGRPTRSPRARAGRGVARSGATRAGYALRSGTRRSLDRGSPSRGGRPWSRGPSRPRRGCRSRSSRRSSRPC